MLRSRIIAWLRVLLPLAALASLSSIFLIQRQSDPDAAIPYAEVDAVAMAREPRINNAEYSTVTGDGTHLTLTADTARPLAPDTSGGGGTAAQAARLIWRAPEGLAADISAGEARIDGDMLYLNDGVRMTTSTGWLLTGPRFNAETDRSTLVSDGPVTGFGPLGRIDAEAVAITPQPGGKDHLLNLSGGVRLLYQP